MPKRNDDREHDEDIVSKLRREIQCDREETRRLVEVEQERLATLAEILGAIQSLSVALGELCTEVTESSVKSNERLCAVEESVSELHRVFMGFVSYLNNELVQELQAGRVTQEGLGHLLEKLFRGFTDAVLKLGELDIHVDGPPGFSKFNQPVIDKTEVLELLNERFTGEELNVLCFRLGIEWDELEGDTKLLKTASLIRWINDRRLAGEFKKELAKFRPDINGLNVAGNNRFGTRPLGRIEQGE